jgi:uncharacterized integral membrane protein
VIGRAEPVPGEAADAVVSLVLTEVQQTSLSSDAMRLFYFILLLLFAGALVAFCVQNQEPVSIKFLEWNLSYPLSAYLVAAYVLGMFSGWTVVGMIRRSLRRVSERN